MIGSQLLPLSWSEILSRWAFQTFGRPTAGRSFERMKEEFDELAAHFKQMPDGSYALKFGHEGRAAEEMADVVICAAQLVAAMHRDLAQEVDKKHYVNSVERRWVSHGEGTGHHIKNDHG